MADLVNPTHKERLSVKNQETSHIAGKAPYAVLGGPGIASEPGGDDYKLDATNGIGTDTTIPKSVGAESSHLKTEDAPDAGDDVTSVDDEPDVSFGDEDEPAVDDLDKELDEFEDIDPVDVDVDVNADEPEDELKKEEFEAGDEKKDDEDGEKEKVEEEDDPFKDGSEKDDELKEEDESDDSEKKNENPFAKKDKDEDEKDGEKDDVKESVKIRIKMPEKKLFESVGIPAKAQKRVGVILESVVKNVAKQISSQVNAHYRKLHESKLAKRDALMAKQMDAYLSYVAEEWVKANKVTIRQSLRTQLAEEFLNGLQRLFKEHYIDVPESKVDVVAKLTEQVTKLKGQLNEQVVLRMKLRKLAESANKARIVSEMSRGLSVEQTAKLRKLAEDTEYKTAKEFRGKLTMLKESYFGTAKPKRVKTLPEEQLQEASKPDNKRTSSGDPDVDAVASVLSAQAKRDNW